MKQYLLIILSIITLMPTYAMEKTKAKSDNSKYRAISSDGNLVATLYSINESGLPEEREDLLSITNLLTKKTESHNLPPSFEWYQGHSTITFNKQGTHIIAYIHESQPYIFQLTVNTLNHKY